MELLILWALSIVASYNLDVVRNFMMIKDIADMGYKINIKGENSPLFVRASKSTIDSFTFMINIMDSIESLAGYMNDKNATIGRAYNDDLLVRMTDKELEEYRKDPTFINAFIIMNRNIPLLETDETMEISIFYKEGEETSRIYFKSKGNSIKVTRSEGPVSILSVKEQKHILDYAFVPILYAANKHYGLKKFEKKLAKEGEINLDEILEINKKYNEKHGIPDSEMQDELEQILETGKPKVKEKKRPRS